MSVLMDSKSGMVNKQYDSESAAADAAAWYARRDPRCVPQRVEHSGQMLHYQFVDGTIIPRDWQAVRDAAAQWIWGKVQDAGHAPYAAVKCYCDYVISRARLLWHVESERPLHVDSHRLYAATSAMYAILEHRHLLHWCDDVHGDLTLENCILADGDARIVFIDPGNPRGLVCVENDLAKLLQSYDGWEAIKLGMEAATAAYNPRPFYGKVESLVLLSHYIRALCHCSPVSKNPKHNEQCCGWLQQRVDELLLCGGYLEPKYCVRGQ